MGINQISKATLQRLPTYVTYLKSLPANASSHISATAIAAALGLGEVQVRKDLASAVTGGRPKVGYVVKDLICELDRFLGFNSLSEAVLIGCGKMGRAVLEYRDFNRYGLKIVAGFDIDPNLIGSSASGKKILPMTKLKSICSRNHIRLAVIAVPTDQAQSVCDQLVACGIQGIMNIAPVHLNVPDGVIVRNENLAIELALLAGQVEAKCHEENLNK